MKPDDFEHSPAGKCMRTYRDYCAFVPNPLPPAIEYDAQLVRLLSDADRLIGELSGIGRVLKNPYLLISPYIRREAVSSSKIEGTQSSLSDLFFYEATYKISTQAPDVKEVHNYCQGKMKMSGFQQNENVWFSRCNLNRLFLPIFPFLKQLTIGFSPWVIS